MLLKSVNYEVFLDKMLKHTEILKMYTNWG